MGKDFTGIKKLVCKFVCHKYLMSDGSWIFDYELEGEPEGGYFEDEWLWVKEKEVMSLSDAVDYPWPEDI